jgi:hypothetical protein
MGAAMPAAQVGFVRLTGASLDALPLPARRLAQIHYERLHHEARLRWLSDRSPQFACGTLVPKHERQQMTAASLRCLAELSLGCTSNCIDLNNVAGLDLLDAE